MNNPIIQRELFGMLRTPKALLMQAVPACLFTLLVVLRWPTDARVDLTGAQAQDVFSLFAYGLLATLTLLVPAFPATAIVREKNRGTLALLLNSPLSPWAIYFGKLAGVLGFVVLPLIMSIPAAAACYAMGGLSLYDQILTLYVVLAVLILQYSALGLYISSSANTPDSALRVTYGAILALSVLTLGPYQFLQGKDWGAIVTVSLWLQSLSPISAIMELLGHGDARSQRLISQPGNPFRFVLLSLASTVAFMLATIARLQPLVFDRPRSQGIITDDRSTGQQLIRRLIFLVDPQRRKGAIGRFTNPVMVKEFRCRRFGSSHWMMRLVAVCAMASLGLTYTSTAGTFDWGVEMIGGIMVILQVSLIILLTPSLAAGLISGERESGGWTLLQMTPLSTWQIVIGKLLSVVWTLALILVATLPGYAVMIFIKPSLSQQISYVLFSLVLTALLALILSAAVSSLFRRTAPATVTAYTLLLVICSGPMLFWLGRDTTFGHRTVETMLMLNPLAAALTVMEAPGFAQYHVVPVSWWITGCASLACLAVLCFQTWRLTRPQ